MSEQRTIGIIAPIIPFRSGIAKHTTELAMNLVVRENVNLHIVSFKRQYPGFLFPGESDRDPNGRTPEALNADFTLDSLNPFSWVSTARFMRNKGVDFIIIPSWTFFLAPCLGVIAWLCRRAGIPVIMIVHNVIDHEASFLKRLLSKFQLSAASVFMTHGSELEKELGSLGLEQQVIVHPHPIFDHFPDAKATLPAVTEVEILFFGLMRPYKGLDIALRALAKSGRKDIHLSIVGEFWEGKDETLALISELGLTDQIELTARYVTDEEAAEYFCRADAVLLPYKQVTGSGVVPVAYRYNTPVIVTDLVGLTEVVCENETGWVVPVNDVEALATLLKEKATRENLQKMIPSIERFRQTLSWSSYADSLLDRMTVLEKGE